MFSLVHFTDISNLITSTHLLVRANRHEFAILPGSHIWMMNKPHTCHPFGQYFRNADRPCRTYLWRHSYLQSHIRIIRSPDENIQKNSFPLHALMPYMPGPEHRPSCRTASPESILQRKSLRLSLPNVRPALSSFRDSRQNLPSLDLFTYLVNRIPVLPRFICESSMHIPCFNRTERSVHFLLA